MRLTCWGAAGTVTGSMHLVESAGRRILLDCGLYQGKREAAFDRNRDLPFDVGSIDAVVLSHAHADHAANLPTLYRQGFRGDIWCTSATRDLCAYTLLDSAHIQETDVAYVNRRRKRKGLRPYRPLYTSDDALGALGCFVTVDYGRPFQPVPGVTAVLGNAGHILGSAHVTVQEHGQEGPVRLLFSGDLGRGGLAIIRDPETVEGIDFLLMESTYGDRAHESSGEAVSALERVIHETCRLRGGKVIIPSFALGRTQEIVFRLNQLWESGRMPRVNVFVDSPLAVNLTEVFRLHPECYDDETRAVMRTDPDRDPLGFAQLHYVRSAERSRQLNGLREPAIIISASGMCESGRILHHLANHVGDPNNCVLFVGFQAEDTLGRRLKEGAEVVRIFGEEHRVRARIESVEGYSAHADRDELLHWAAGIRDAGRLEGVLLVHGETPAFASLSALLEEHGFPAVKVAQRGESIELTPPSVSR